MLVLSMYSEYYFILNKLHQKFFSDIYISSRDETLTRDFIITKIKELAFEEKMITIFFNITCIKLE
jgi:hypothetical protein